MEKGQTPPGGEWEKAQGELRLVEEIITPNPETMPQEVPRQQSHLLFSSFPCEGFQL